MRYIHRTTAQYLSQLLSLEASGEEQDWAIEMADGDRVEEFIAHYDTLKSNDNYAFALVALIVSSFDDHLIERLNKFELEYFEIMEQSNYDVNIMYNKEERALWNKIANIIKSNPTLFYDIINYWSAIEDDETSACSTLLFRDTFAPLS